MAQELQGKRIAFLATDGVEQIELTRPWQEMVSAGATVELISLKEGEIQGVHHDKKGGRFQVDRTVEKARASDYDGLVLPGGVFNPDALRTSKKAVTFTADFFKQEKPIAAICHGPWLLVEAGVVHDHKLTSWPSLKTDISNAGGVWVNEEVCIDNSLTTSRNPDDLDAFCTAAIQQFSKGWPVRH